jgi:hypothetical protein
MIRPVMSRLPQDKHSERKRNSALFFPLQKNERNPELRIEVDEQQMNLWNLPGGRFSTDWFLASCDHTVASEEAYTAAQRLLV